MLHVPSPISPLISYSRSRVPVGSVWPGVVAGARTASTSWTGGIGAGCSCRTCDVAIAAVRSGPAIVGRDPGRTVPAAPQGAQQSHVIAKRAAASGAPSGWGRAAPSKHAESFHAQHGLVRLVHHVPVRADHADPGLARERPRLEDLEPHVQRVAGKDGPQPAE